MTKDRIQFLVDPVAKHRYDRAASANGMTLSAWLRHLAESSAPEDPAREMLATRDALETFFRQSDATEAALFGSRGGGR